MKLIEFALKFKTTVFVLILFIIIVGWNSYRSLPLEAAPDVEIPIIIVQTIYPGVAPEDIEKLITNPIERELKDLDDVKKLTSTSADSASVVQIEFETDVEMDDAVQKVREKIDLAKPDLPPDAEETRLIEINVSEFPMMLVNLTADYGMAKLKTVAEALEDEIETIPGVLEVDLVGGLEREIQIYLDPNRMEYYTIGVGQVIDRIRQEHLTTPAGTLDVGGSEYTVRIPGEYKNVKLMEDIVIKAPNGNPIKLKDIGRVVDGFKDRTSISRANGQEGVTLRVKKRAGENIVRIADDVRALLKAHESTFPVGTTYFIRQDESKRVRDMVADLENNIITALILVLAVLFFAMGLRNAAFVAIAIPLSMLMSFIVLRAMGITLNMVVLFGLIMALGMLVDNSIVVIENIFRHASEGKSRAVAALEATKEIAWPIITSTLTTVVAFAPLIFWPGIMGEFMVYLPITIISTLLASLFVALVINPVVAATMLSDSGKKLFDDSGEATGPILKTYKRVLNWSLDHPWLVVGLSNVMLVAAVILYVKFGAGVELFPDTTPERAQVTITSPQGTRLERSDEYSFAVEGIVSKDDNLKDMVANVGIGSGHVLTGGGGGSGNLAVLDIEFKDRHERVHSTWDSIENYRAALKNLAGAEYKVEVQKNGPPTGDPVGVEISGDELSVANDYARQVKEILSDIPNVVDIQDDFEGGKPEIHIDVDREQAMLRKVNTMGIGQAVRAAINGVEASKLRDGEDEYDITVRYDKPYRESINDILDITVMGKDDVQIPLRDVARVRTVGGLGDIKHIDRKRTIKVSADVQGRSSAEVMVDVEAAVRDKLKLAPGYTVRFSGETEEQQRAGKFLSEAFSVGILMMLMILITQFNSLLRPAIILGSVVMSLIGVLLGLIITQNKFGIIMTGMGVISLAGVVVNNAIVLIDYVDQLMAKADLTLREALVRAGMVRFRPVLLTAVTTVLGLLPMAIGFGIDFTTMSIDTGSSTVEWWGPMARAVSFGLTFATILTLVMVPVMYLVQDTMVRKVLDLYRRISGRKKSEIAPTQAS